MNNSRGGKEAMRNHPKDLQYTKTHEWVRRHDHVIDVGITDFAQHQLSDITYVELPEIDRRFDSSEEVVVVESIKAATDVYAPVSGVVVEVNANLESSPEVINSDPYGAGWLFRMEPDNIEDVDGLMSSDEYESSLPEEE